MTTPITYTIDSNLRNPQIQEEAAPSTGRPLQAALRMSGDCSGPYPLRTGRPGRLVQTNSLTQRKRLGTPEEENQDAFNARSTCLRHSNRCFTRQPRCSWSCHVDVCDHHRTHKEPVMAKSSEQDREVRPNEITPPQYHTSWSPSSLSIRYLLIVLKSLWLVERHHADIHASEQRILHIILQTTEVLGSIKEGVLSNCGGAIMVIACVIPDDR